MTFYEKFHRKEEKNELRTVIRSVLRDSAAEKGSRQEMGNSGVRTLFYRRE